MEIYDKIFLVNLSYRTDRLAFMKHKLQKEGIKNYNVVKAVNGYSEDNIGLFDMFKDREYYYGIISSPGAIGLLITWRKMLRRCIRNKLNRILVLEDDIYFHKNFKDLHSGHIQLFNNYNVVLLGGNQLRWDATQSEEIKTQDHYHFSDNKWHCTYGTYAISLDRKAMKEIYYKLRAGLQESSMTLDVEINKLIRDGVLTGVTMYPNVIIPEMRDSDNMGTRDMSEVAISRRWELDNYNYLSEYDEIMRMRREKINPRQNELIAVGDIDRDTLIKIFDGKQLPMAVIIPSYNNSKWVDRNLMSVINQNYYNWRAIYIDDASEDKTFDKAQKIIDDNDSSGSIVLIKNSNRRFQTYNRYMAYMSCGDEEICVMLDGDDWLSHADVFDILNEEYRKNNLLVSYGHFIYYENKRLTLISGKYEFPKDIIENNTYRKYNWISQHLRTCKAKIIKQIPVYQLKDQDGKWLTRCSDMAEMFWALENSKGRHKNIGSLLCVYNKDNSKIHPNSYYNEDDDARNKLIEYIRGHPIPGVDEDASHSTDNCSCDDNNTDDGTGTGDNDNVDYDIPPVKYCYQLEFIQSETSVIPATSHINSHIFMVKAKLFDDHNYDFSIKDPEDVFRFLSAQKVRSNEYYIYVISNYPLGRLDNYHFNVVARCNTCAHADFVSDRMYVHTFNNSITADFKKRMNVKILPDDHGQKVKLIRGDGWTLEDDCRVTKRISRDEKREIYRLKILFNDKLLEIYINLKKRQSNECVIS